MNHRIVHFTMYLALSIGLWPALSFAAIAHEVSGPADVGRVKPEEKLFSPGRRQDQHITIPSGVPSIDIPEAAKSIHFVLKDVRIVGATAFTQASFTDLYTQHLNKEITLDVAYVVAGMITERYRNAGYFLSRAYVPAQEIENGVVTINVSEGYIGKVELPETMQSHSVIQLYISELTAQKPLSAQKIESFLLRLNDLPGYSISGTLSTLDSAKNGAVKLTLEAADRKGKGQISFDNFSSRFLGPNEIIATYTKSLLPLQQTTVSGLTSLPSDRLNYATLNHAFVIAPDITLDVTGGFTKAIPGFTLEPFEIESDSTFLSTSVNYQWIRQRQENLSLKFSLDSRNINSDLLDTPLARDRIRALRLSANYDAADKWHGYNIASVKLSQGIDSLGSSRKGDINLSRAQAKPDFTKVEWSVTRLQGITSDWSLLITASGQKASGSLFSAEEFGYGGQGFGRAFDASEIIGDHGMAGSLELRYGGWNDWHPVSVSPYAFYDIGRVWNEDIAQTKVESGASAGFGIRAATPIGLNGNIGLAWPLTRDAATPIYGQENSDPRILLQISQDF